MRQFINKDKLLFKCDEVKIINPYMSKRVQEGKISSIFEYIKNNEELLKYMVDENYNNTHYHTSKS